MFMIQVVECINIGDYIFAIENVNRKLMYEDQVKYIKSYNCLAKRSYN